MTKVLIISVLLSSTFMAQAETPAHIRCPDYRQIIATPANSKPLHYHWRGQSSHGETLSGEGDGVPDGNFFEAYNHGTNLLTCVYSINDLYYTGYLIPDSGWPYHHCELNHVDAVADEVGELCSTEPGEHSDGCELVCT